MRHYLTSVAHSRFIQVGERRRSARAAAAEAVINAQNTEPAEEDLEFSSPSKHSQPLSFGFWTGLGAWGLEF